MTRYFFAVSPPESLSQQIDAFRGKWGHPHHRVEPHVTVKAPFLWDGESSFLTPVQEACRGLSPFAMTLGRPGRFTVARVLFLTVASEGLQDLHETVVAAMAPLLGEMPSRQEGKEYHPHLTLAAGRFGIDAAGLEGMETDARQVLGDLPPFFVTALRCFRWNEQSKRWDRLIDVPLGGQ